MKSKFFLTAALPLMAAALTLVFTGCSGDDDIVPESREGQSDDKGYTIFSTGTPGTRTTMGKISLDKDGKLIEPIPFYWTDGDYIWVQDDDGFWRKSEPLDIPEYSWGWPTANFKVSGTFSPDKPHKVRYTGCAKYNVGAHFGFLEARVQFDQVRPLNFEDGDCGVDTAKWENGHYTFTLKHKVAFLCILPYSKDKNARDYYMLMTVKIMSEDPICGTFRFDANENIYFADQENEEVRKLINIATNPYYEEDRVRGMWVRTDKPDPRYCVLYSSILPGKHKLKVIYNQEFQTETMRLYGNQTIQDLGEVTLEAGKVYTIKGELKEPEVKVREIY